MESLLVWIAIGLVAGWLASLLLGGKGLVRYIVIGMLGSVVGGYLVAFTGIHLPVANFWIREILVAAIGAMIVIIVARLIAR